MPEIVPAFPLLDAARADANAELSRVILAFCGYVEPNIPELDDWCSVPVRLVHACLQVTEQVWQPMHLSRFITIAIWAMTFISRSPPASACG